MHIMLMNENIKENRKYLFVISLLLSTFAFLLCACSQNESNGTLSNGIDQPSWQEQYDLGMKYLVERNYSEAIIAFTLAIEIDPKQPLAYIGRGNAYLGIEDNVENLTLARSDYEIALKLDDTLADAYLRLAKVYVSLGEVEKATELLKRGIEKTGKADLEDLLSQLVSEIEVSAASNLSPQPQGFFVDIPVTVLSSEGVQPAEASIYFWGDCDTFATHTSGNVKTTLNGAICIDMMNWSDQQDYMLISVMSTPQQWQSDLERSTPISFYDSSIYKYYDEHDRSYDEVYKQRFYSWYHPEARYHQQSGNTLMIDNDVWILIVAAYDKDGIRCGLTVYQLENTPDFLAARAACTETTNLETGEKIP